MHEEVVGLSDLGSTVMTLDEITEDLLRAATYDSCAMALDGGSIAVGFRSPDGIRFLVVLDRQVGSSRRRRAKALLVSGYAITEVATTVA